MLTKAQSKVQPNCASCRFAELRHSLRCHRFPPQIDRSSATGYDFPVVASTDWCGEFESVS